jgi:hypothetical protein
VGHVPQCLIAGDATARRLYTVTFNVDTTRYIQRFKARSRRRNDIKGVVHILRHQMRGGGYAADDV